MNPYCIFMSTCLYLSYHMSCSIKYLFACLAAWWCPCQADSLIVSGSYLNHIRQTNRQAPTVSNRDLHKVLYAFYDFQGVYHGWAKFSTFTKKLDPWRRGFFNQCNIWVSPFCKTVFVWFMFAQSYTAIWQGRWCGIESLHCTCALRIVFIWLFICECNHVLAWV